MKATGICGSCEVRRAHENPAFASSGCWVPFVVKGPAVSCRNQSKSNQIKPNPTKSNHYFFQTGEGAARSVRWLSSAERFDFLRLNCGV